MEVDQLTVQWSSTRRESNLFRLSATEWAKVFTLQDQVENNKNVLHTRMYIYMQGSGVKNANSGHSYRYSLQAGLVEHGMGRACGHIKAFDALTIPISKRTLK